MSSVFGSRFRLKTWLWVLGCVLWCSCGGPQEGGDRGNDDDHQHEEESDSGTDGECLPRCDVNARCDDSGDSPQCKCNPGFEGNGRSCTDVDECEAATHDCADDATCENRDGGFRCKCNPGFAGDGKTCDSVAQCTGDTNVCDPNAACDDSGSSVSCECNAGFDGDGLGCGDVDECEDDDAFECADNARCVNRFGGYDCECEPLYEGDGATSCRTLCEGALADSDRCSDNGLCRVRGDAAVCDACEPGYSGDGIDCTSGSCGDECDGSGGDDVEHAVCDGSGGCECAPGYEGDSGSGCDDIDECEDDNGGCGDTSECQNLEGGYFCECKPGYERNGSGGCVDIDECAADASPCHPDATCENADPADVTAGFTCTCKDGFTGDGSICRDLDECTEDDDACGGQATCINRRGSFACECRPPFTGDDGDCYCDLSGYWGMRQDVDTCWEDLEIMEGSGVILVSAGSTEATAWELHRLVYDGDTLQVEKQGCGSDIAPDLVSPFFGETYSSDVPVETWDELGLLKGADVEVSNIVPGMSFVTPDEAAVVGIDLGDDPLNATWPVTHTDVNDEGGEAPAWVDTDNDGEPGITIWPKLPSQLTNDGTGYYSYIPARARAAGDDSLEIEERAGCTSVALRVISRLEIDVESCTRMVGEMIDLGTKGRVHSCTLVPEADWEEDISCDDADWDAMDMCLDTDIDNLDDDQNQEQTSLVRFELVRIADLDEEPSCLDVRDELPAIERETPDITCD